MNQAHVLQAAESLNKILGPELSQIVKAISQEPGPDNPFFIDLPDANVVDLNPEDLASYVARTSNTYGRMARFAGMARAQYKIAEGRYKHKLKTSFKGANKEEREANAMEAAAAEHVALTTIEAVVELAESLEAAARISSESSRKLFDKVQSMQIASAREERGHFKASDFRH